jgi:hypothetical protein
MNRLSRLELAIDSWSKFHLITDIVIVDWSSKEPVSNSKPIVENQKVHIVRVENQQYFSLAKSFNLAYDFTNTQNKILVKIDTDYLLTDETIFYKLLTSSTFDGKQLKNFFFTGSYLFTPGLSGFLLINKKDFCYYNENMIGWGFDDMDLYERIKTNNINHIVVPTLSDYVYHIPHGDHLRVENYSFRDKQESRQENKNISDIAYKRIRPRYLIEKQDKKYTELNIEYVQ